MDQLRTRNLKQHLEGAREKMKESKKLLLVRRNSKQRSETKGGDGDEQSDTTKPNPNTRQEVSKSCQIINTQDTITEKKRERKSKFADLDGVSHTTQKHDSSVQC